MQNLEIKLLLWVDGSSRILYSGETQSMSGEDMTASPAYTLNVDKGVWENSKR